MPRGYLPPLRRAPVSRETSIQAETSSFGSSPLHKATAMLFQTKKGADVTFVLLSKKILAHKSLLIGRSSVFEAMFVGAMAYKDPRPIIRLNNFDATITEFETFLEYLYTDKIDINLKNMHSIFKLAHMYDISSLLKECTLIFKKHFQLSNIFEFASFSHLYQDTCSLFNDVLQFICENTSKVLNLPEFNKLNAAIIAEILKCDNLEASEENLFQIVYKWATEETKRQNLEINTQNICSVCVTVMEHIRFPLMDPMFLISNVRGKEILSSTDFSDALSDAVIISNGESEKCTSRFNRKSRIGTIRRGRRPYRNF